MKRLAGYLRRANSWAAIAVVALLGWLIDSFLLFIETHPFTGRGFLTFVSHSWYALPLLGAIFIILRLRRPSELLSLTVYDERGTAIHRRGDFQLEDSVFGPIFASFQSTAQRDGLHRLDLASGAVVYFLRRGALTLVACFSAPPGSAQLEEELRWLQQQGPATEDLLRGLPSDVAALATNLLSAPAARDVLTYLWTHQRVAMTAGDLAWQVGQPEEEVASALENLEQLALVHRQCVCDTTFYRLTQDRAWLERLDQFVAWRSDWLARARRVEQLVGPLKLIEYLTWKESLGNERIGMNLR